ncbi:hypothetical protein LMG22037_01306 [Paraburkholderia phenoliruptrix]|uniref:Uncharacterized protein n=1 Tax=Paraburkholderia phenoliruptrix TaxID=252970 RepID=A0A6J5AD85_9BURK|nr:hypothetical protein [Paraburkholderia phenoliruptrix]CAB3658063.1 hypothetical protein LMG22037_01306 [Paraburkholderia phenoliruptrix]
MKADLILEQQSQKNKTKVAYSLYGVALLCCILSLLAMGKNFQATIFSSGLAALCAVSLTLGFLIRVQPILAQIWGTAFGKLLLAFCSAFTAVIASVPARHVVSGAMSLPANDFPTTLTFWTILCYPAVAISFATVVFLAVYVILLIIAALIALSTQPPIDGFIRGALNLLPSKYDSQKRLVNSRWRLTMVMFADAFAAAILSVIAAYSLTGWYRVVDQPNLVRLFAYWADYETPTAYPGIEKDAVRLLENGVVSYARRGKWDVAIRVACLKGLSCPLS